MYREAKEDLHALRIPITGRSGRWLLNLIDRVKVDEVTHRAVVADGWYRNIPEFHQGVDDRGESYVAVTIRVKAEGKTVSYSEHPRQSWRPAAGLTCTLPQLHPQNSKLGLFCPFINPVADDIN